MLANTPINVANMLINIHNTVINIACNGTNVIALGVGQTGLVGRPQGLRRSVTVWLHRRRGRRGERQHERGGDSLLKDRQGRQSH